MSRLAPVDRLEVQVLVDNSTDKVLAPMAVGKRCSF
jgi:hypothetical protein